MYFEGGQSKLHITISSILFMMSVSFLNPRSELENICVNKEGSDSSSEVDH